MRGTAAALLLAILALPAFASPGALAQDPAPPAPAGEGADEADPLALLRSADPAERARGREALAAEEAGDLLLRALGTRDPLVREAAASAVAERPEAADAGIRVALRAILRDRAAGESARRAAARALGAVRDPAAALELRAALPDLPRDAALALAALGDAGALVDLRRLRDAPDGARIPEVAYALAALGDRSGEDLLLELLGGADPALSTSALHLLRRLTGKDLGPSVSRWTEEVRVRRLAADLGDRDWDRTEEALKATRARGPAAVADLVAILEDPDSGTEARGKAALALGLLGSRDAGPALLEASRPGEDPWVRVYALEALGRIAWSPAAPVLARMLVHDEDPEPPRSFFDGSGPYHTVQSAAARALLEMGAEGALGVVVDQLSRGGVALLPAAFVGEYRVRVYYEALAMLRDFGGPRARDGFGFVPDGNAEPKREAGARAVAWWLSRPRDLTVADRADWTDPAFVAGVEREIEILGRYKFLEMDRSRRALILLGRVAVPRLVAALAADPASDPGGASRIGVAEVLASIGAPEAAAPLREGLARARLAPVRARLLVSLGRLGPAGGVPEAVPFLASAAFPERAAAAEALAHAPTPGAGPALRRALDGAGADPLYRVYLAAALLGLRDGDAAGILLDALADPDASVRRKAWEALHRRVEGLGPFDPEAGEGAAAVRERWEAMAARPRWRDGGDGGR